MFDETLQREEEQEVVNRLVELTERGKIHWECEELFLYPLWTKIRWMGSPPT